MRDHSMRRGANRLFVPRGFAEGELWALRSQFVPRRYFSMMVSSYRFAAPPPPPADTYYLDTTAGGGGDGSIGSPWNTLEAARAGLIALHSSLVTDTVNPTLICFGATDDSTAVTNTWPTSSTTYYLTIKTPDADRKVQWDANVYTYARSVDGATGAALAIGTNSIRLKGIQIRQLANTGLFCRPYEITSLGGEAVHDGVKFRGSGAANNSVSVQSSGTVGRFVFRNCMATESLHGFLLGNPTGLQAGTEVDIYNCSIFGIDGTGGEGCQLTWAAGGSGKIARVKNLLSRSRANGISTTNENTEDLATNSHGTASGAANFVDPVNADYRLVSGSEFLDVGTDLSGVADFPFSDDASLYTRPYNGTWDIGMHEYQP
jgi:hypothetical protein